VGCGGVGCFAFFVSFEGRMVWAFGGLRFVC
jgi:hypothetical protein